MKKRIRYIGNKKKKGFRELFLSAPEQKPLTNEDLEEYLLQIFENRKHKLPNAPLLSSPSFNRCLRALTTPILQSM